MRTPKLARMDHSEVLHDWTGVRWSNGNGSTQTERLVRKAKNEETNQRMSILDPNLSQHPCYAKTSEGFDYLEFSCVAGVPNLYTS